MNLNIGDPDSKILLSVNAILSVDVSEGLK